MKLVAVIVCFIFYVVPAFTQNLSREAISLSHLYNDYMASGEMMDTKDNIKAIKKCISKINKTSDTTALVILLEVYLKYDASENDVKELSYMALLGFKKQLIPIVILKLGEAELEYGNQKNRHTDYMDLVALKKKLTQ